MGKLHWLLQVLMGGGGAACKGKLYWLLQRLMGGSM